MEKAIVSALPTLDGSTKPFRTLEYNSAALAAITTWQWVNERCYELTVETYVPDEPQPGHGGIMVKFARAGEQPNANTDQWDAKLRAGQQISVPDGADGFWWYPDTSQVGLRLVLTLVKGVHYAPHVPDALVPVTTPISYPASTLINAADPTTSVQGNAVPADATEVSVRIVDVTSGSARLATDVSVDVWWQFLDAAVGVMWAHNGDDDFDAASPLGVANGSHDVEVYRIPVGAVRIALVWRSGLTAATAQGRLAWRTAR